MNRIFRFTLHYPLTLLCVAAVWYLSMYRVPPPPVHLFSWFDKLVHFCMYAGISGLAWYEYARHHRKASVGQVVWGAVFCPVVMGGLVELAQAYLTTYRTGDWTDFLANSLGAATASAIAACAYQHAGRWPSSPHAQ